MDWALHSKMPIEMCIGVILMSVIFGHSLWLILTNPLLPHNVSFNQHYIIIGCSIGTPVLVVVVLVTGAGGPDILLEEGIPK